MFCGTGNFKHMDEDPQAAVPASPPKESKKKASKNPYSMRGLDKFSTVLSELESKRERIMSRAGSQGVAMVRFAYSSSHDNWVPIVVRRRDEGKDKDKASETVEEASTSTLLVGEERAVLKEKKNKGLKKGFSGVSYYWLLVVVLILVCLAFSGRVFAVCCISIWWYLVPSMKTKGIGKRVSECKKRMVGGDK